jgi:hypothetical protein
MFPFGMGSEASDTRTQTRGRPKDALRSTKFTGYRLTGDGDGGGNVPPQRALARELKRRGHDVHMLTHYSLRETVTSDGVTHHALATAAPGAETEFIVLSAAPPLSQRISLPFMTRFARTVSQAAV